MYESFGNVHKLVRSIYFFIQLIHIHCMLSRVIPPRFMQTEGIYEGRCVAILNCNSLPAKRMVFLLVLYLQGWVSVSVAVLQWWRSLSKLPFLPSLLPSCSALLFFLYLVSLIPVVPSFLFSFFYYSYLSCFLFTAFSLSILTFLLRFTLLTSLLSLSHFSSPFTIVTFLFSSSFSFFPPFYLPSLSLPSFPFLPFLPCPFLLPLILSLCVDHKRMSILS